MKYALINGERKEATKGSSGICVGCGNQTIAKCGDKKIHHWAHKSKVQCDPWWENETEWHRNWKNLFPVEWQEIVHPGNSEVHIADVKTSTGWVIEFQHSAISTEERDSRNSFYPMITWVVDGSRLKRDEPQFFKSLASAVRTATQPQVLKVDSFECSLLKKWLNTGKPVLLDFSGKENLWMVLPILDGAWSHVLEISRADFIDLHLGKPTQWGECFTNLIKGLVSMVVTAHVQQVKAREQQALQQQANQLRAKMAWQNRFGRRF